MFITINKLVDILTGIPVKEEVDKIVQSLVEYKKYHFSTEEKYFDEFNYPDKENHKAKHREFNQKLEVLVKDYGNDSITFAFKLIDFLEDWLINHLMVEDQKYVACFHEHGLT